MTAHEGLERSARHDTDALGVEREFLVAVPPRPIAVAVAFHPWGFDPESVLDGEQPGDRLRRPLPGLALPAALLGIALVLPRSVGRVGQPGVSLAWRDHLDASWRVADELAAELGISSIATLGLSQGGLEALVFAGQHSDKLVAAVAVNPIVDLAALHRDSISIPIAHMVETGGVEELEKELGGTPDEVPEAYAERSAISYVDELSRVPLTLIWSEVDGVIQDQEHHHSGRLGALLRPHGATLDERRVTMTPPNSEDAGRYAHESFDAWEALGAIRDAVRIAQGRVQSAQ